MGNFLATIIVFLAALLIMHVLVLFKSRDHKLWLFVDYIWLSMAFLSLIGITADARKFLAESKLSQEETYLEIVKERFHKHLSSEAAYYHNLPYESWKYNRDEIPKFKATSQWYQSAFNAFKDGIKSESWGDFQKDHFDFPQNLGGQKSSEMISIIFNSKRTTEMFLKDVVDSSDKVDSLKVKSGSKWYEIWLILFYPFLISVALAMRISKVSANFRELSANN